MNVDPTSLSLTSWTLHALTSGGVNTLIADGTAGQDWQLQSSQAGLSLDYIPGTGGQIDGALFNFASVGSSALPGGQNTVWFTTATLKLNFNGDVSGLGSRDCSGNLGGLGDCSVLLRFQQVGDGGSLKLPGTPGNPIPEPSTVLLFGSGLAGLGLWRWKTAKRT